MQAISNIRYMLLISNYVRPASVGFNFDQHTFFMCNEHMNDETSNLKDSGYSY